MGQGLTGDQVAAFRERGFVTPLPAVTPGEAATLYDRFAAFEAQAGGRLSRALNEKPYLFLRWIADVVCDSRVLDPVESVLGPDILCWAGGFFAKRPGDGAIVSWHQDATYWGLSAPDVVTAWIALTPSTPDSGCMRVIPGTHRAQIAHRDTFAAGNLLSRGQEVQCEVNESEAVDLVLAPGEMSLHHTLLIHGSGPNRAAHPRVGLAIRYIAGHVRQTLPVPDSAMLVRGRRLHDDFATDIAPDHDWQAAAVERHRRFVSRHQDLLYAGAAQRPDPENPRGTPNAGERA